MSQIEHDFQRYVSLHPELLKCFSLINKRALARYLIKKKVVSKTSVDAVIAMLRRFDVPVQHTVKDVFSSVRTSLKDHITIFNFHKSTVLVERLKDMIDYVDPLKNETLKVVLGSTSVKVFIDELHENRVRELVRKSDIISCRMRCSEMSLIFPDSVESVRGVLAAITRELSINDIVIAELLSCSPELLIYVEEYYILSALQVVKGLTEKG